MNKRKKGETKSFNISKRAKSAAEGHFKENVMRYNLMPSLEHMAAVKVAVALWSRACIQDEIYILCSHRAIHCRRCDRYDEYSNFNEIFQEVKNEILDIVPELSEYDVTRKILSGVVGAIGREIFDWIEYHDRYVFNIRMRQNLSANYLHSLVWTSRGIIDYEKTAKRVLPEMLKFFMYSNSYFLACANCLEEDAAAIGPNVPYRIDYYTCTPNYYYLPFYDFKPTEDGKTMVMFWSSLLKGDFTNLTREVCDYNKRHGTEYGMNEYIFKKLVSTKKHRNNQVAIKFMWNRLSDEEKSRRIVSVMKYSKTDLKCFFLSQLNEAQQKHAFRAEGGNMLRCLLDDWLWKDYFLPTMHYVWNVIPELDFLRVIEDIVQRRMEEHYEDEDEYNRYKAILKELWRSAPARLKEFIFEHQDGSRGSGIFFGLLCTKSMDLIQLMLPDINDGQKKAMLCSSPRNFRKCYWLIINDQIDVVKRFIDEAIFSEEDVDMFKQKLVESYGCDAATHFIQNQKWDEVDQFMRWVFKSDHDKREFKAKLAYGDICDGILESIVVKYNERGFRELDHFFLWCSSESTQKVLDLKREMHRVYFTKVHCELIKKGKYQLLEKFLNWCFQNDKREVELFKHFFCSCSAYNQVVPLVLNLAEKNDNLQSLEKLIRWCFTGSREMTRFKELILEPGRDGEVGACVQLLCKAMFKSADRFVDWCCDSSREKISNFKNELMLYDDIGCLLSRHSHDEEMLGKVLKWFDPSAELLIKFKKKFEDVKWLEDIDVAAHFIRNRKWDEADQFIQLTLESEDERRKFKEELANGRIRDGILESIVANNREGGFVELEEFLQWCVSGNAGGVSGLKDECERYFTDKLFCKLIMEDKYQLIEEFLNWLFSNEAIKVETAKHAYGYHREIAQLILNLVEKNDQLQSLERFVRWCFSRNIEITYFKERILQSGGEGENDICLRLLREGMTELAEEFVRWCCDSSQVEMNYFKNKLMLSDGIIDVLKWFECDDEMSDQIIEWFNPSREMKIQLRKKIETSLDC